MINLIVCVFYDVANAQLQFSETQFMMKVSDKKPFLSGYCYISECQIINRLIYNNMSSYPQRDPKKDHLITPENSVLLIIDYQPIQITSINSMDKRMLIMNMGVLAELAKAYNVPVILSTVNVRTGANKDTIPQIREKLGGITSYDRTSINAWEDKEFREAVKATGRKKLLMAALWTEACLTFPTIDAIKEGFEVYPVVDCVGGTSVIAHECGIRRVEQAGAQLTSLAQLACELQRDWNRDSTKEGFVDIMEEARWFPNLNK